MPPILRTTSCAYISVRRANRAICHLYDLVLAPTQLKASQFMILQMIAESGEIAHCDLAREFAASIETLSRRLAKAREAGLLQMHSGDRHKRIYSLTTKGQRVLAEAMPYWEKAQLRLQRTLGDKDWQSLASFTERMATAAICAESRALSNGNVTLSSAGHA